MMRRGFWMLVGATGGIMGYRRVSAIGRQLSGTLTPAARDARDGGAGQPRGAGTLNGTSAGNGDTTALDRKALDRKALSGKARRGLVRGTIRFTRDARRFGRDVREGMDLYMVRHAAEGSPRLDAGAVSRRSPARPIAPALGANPDNDSRVKDDR
jgi:hypothetical protein